MWNHVSACPHWTDLSSDYGKKYVYDYTCLICLRFSCDFSDTIARIGSFPFGIWTTSAHPWRNQERCVWNLPLTKHQMGNPLVWIKGRIWCVTDFSELRDFWHKNPLLQGHRLSVMASQITDNSFVLFNILFWLTSLNTSKLHINDRCTGYEVKYTHKRTFMRKCVHFMTSSCAIWWFCPLLYHGRKEEVIAVNRNPFYWYVLNLI